MQFSLCLSTRLQRIRRDAMHGFVLVYNAFIEAVTTNEAKLMVLSKEIEWDKYPFIPNLIKKLKSIKPYKVILFGSHAYGEPREDSDIDLIVVLNQRGISQTYREKQEKRKLVHQELLPIEREVSLDTLVYTRDEWTEFLNQGSAFSKLVNREGVLLYEDNHA